MKITSKTIPNDLVDKYTILSKDFKVVDPPKNLLEIYIISRISEIIGLRAEKDWSIENICSVPEKDRKLGVQNTNFTAYLKLVKNVYKSFSLSDFKLLVDWLSKFLLAIGKPADFEIYRTSNYVIDIRHSSTVSECLTFIASFCTQKLKKIIVDLESKKIESKDLTEAREKLAAWDAATDI